MKPKGFTLIELLVVVAIIGILATIVLSSLNSARSKARDAQRERDIKTIQNALEVYFVEHGIYPDLEWANSNNYSGYLWSDLETALGTTLPKDPLNDAGGNAAYDGTYTYSYYSQNNSVWCNGQAYMIVYNKENSNGTDPSDGIRKCGAGADGVLAEYGDAFVAGMSPLQK